jgi:hypothetical protein
MDLYNIIQIMYLQSYVSQPSKKKKCIFLQIYSPTLHLKRGNLDLNCFSIKYKKYKSITYIKINFK